MKKITYIVVVLFLMMSAFPLGQTAKAAQQVIGTFVDVTYSEVLDEEGQVEKQLSKITLQNNSGRTVTYNIDQNTLLYINNTQTTIEGFKMGMKVEAEISLRRVVALRGTSTVSEEAPVIIQEAKTVAGVVTSIDPKGMFIIVKPDVGNETTYYINKDTIYQKNSSAVDISSLYVGDRVKLRFTSASKSIISKVEISTSGTLVEHLYKGEIQTVNANSNKLTMKNQHAFVNWQFGNGPTSTLSTMSFSSKAPIYVGNRKIDKGQLKNYIGSEAYYVTVKQFGKEVIEKIVVLQNNERTYYEAMTAVDTTYQFLKLKSAGRMYYHDGTILIRNDRLIEPTGLVAYGTAFVVTDGGERDQYAQVIQVTNNSFMSPNLASHDLYYGKLTNVDGYLIEIDDAIKIESNVFKKTNKQVLSISNSTKAKVNYRNSTYTIDPYKDLYLNQNQYGYFYVKDNHVQALHMLDNQTAVAQRMLVGKLHSVKSTSPAVINVKSVSQWMNGSWYESGEIIDMDINQSTIIKGGKVIQLSDLNPSDRLVVMSNNFVKGYIILVD